MTENKAAQPGLTDDEVLDAIKAGVRAARDEGLACAGPDNYVVAGALALLSKLRAEGVREGEPQCPQCPRCALPLRQECNCDEGYAGRAALARQAADNLLDYAMYIAHERELDVTGHKHDSDGAVRRFKAAVVRALASAPVAGEAQPVIHQHGFAADNQRLRAINESLDKQLEEVMAERDEYHDVADKLADAIADHLLVEIGEHSSNCPWMRALDAIQNAAPQASEAVRNAEDAARWRWATASDGNADKLCSIVLCHGGYQDKINERADFYRAALSAQPGAQKDGPTSD